MKRLLIFFALLTLSLISAYSQEQENKSFITIFGRVYDATSNEPMRFVSVGLEGTSIANISNSDGLFSLKIPQDSLDEGVIFLSHLGYLEAKIIATDFNGSTGNKPLSIRMTPVTFRLDPAVISASEAETLVKTAYDRVKINYSKEHQGMTAFYRELVKKGDLKYLSLNEAILDIDKSPYTGYASDKAGIYKGRGTINYDSSDTLLIRYQGGVISSLQIDLVKNPFPGVLETEMFKYYDFSMGESIIQDNRLFFCVMFNQKPEVDEPLYRGRLYIDSESFAIGRAEFQVNVEEHPEVVNYYVIKRPQKMIFEVDKVSYTVNYKEHDGLWYYDYGHIEMLFSAHRRYSLFRQHYSTVSELAITDHKPGEIEIQNESKLRLRDQLSERVQDFTDENFWENYNVIEPDTDIEAIVRRIVRQLNRRSATR